MTINIQSIQNSELRKAAEKADSQGENSYNGKLDANEISLFIKEAKEAGCEMGDIMKVVNSDAAIAKTKTANNKIKLQQEIDNLAKKIKTKEQKLASLEKTHNNMKPGLWESMSTSQKIGTSVGAGLGAALGASIAVVSLPVSGPLLAAAGVVCACAGALAGGFDGGFIGTMFDNEKPYNAKVKENKAQQFANDNDIIGLKIEIQELKEELEAKMRLL